MDIFTLKTTTAPKVLVLLPDKICFKTNAYFLKQNVIDNSSLSIGDFAFGAIPVPKQGRIKKNILLDVFETAKNYCDTMGISTVVIGHKDTWDAVTKKAKFTENFGRVVTNGYFSVGSGKKKIEVNFKDYNFIPLLNPIIVKKFPNRKNDLVKSLEILPLVLEGKFSNNFDYQFNNTILTDVEDIKIYLRKALKEPRLFVDIETTGLKWYQDRLLTISFTADAKNPFCIAIHPQYHSEESYKEIKNLLKQFFNHYEGLLIGHNWIGFDQAFIVHEIMRDCDFNIPQEPIINKFKMHDTLLMVYLLKNSTERVKLGLKTLAYKWLGDWDKEIEQADLFNTPLEKVGKYNNLDVIATKLLYDELVAQLKKENMVKTYGKFREIGCVLLKMKMNGLVIDYEKTNKLYNEFDVFIEKEKHAMLSNQYVQACMKYLAYEKQKENPHKSIEELTEEFNPSSNKQKQALFFKVLDLPVLSKTKAGNPATDKNSIDSWLKDDNIDKDKKEVLQLIQEYQMAEKIKNTYLKNMLEDCVEVKKGEYRIFANFNQTGTISGRLSSSGAINFQTIPSGSKYGKLIKSLFIAPEGYLLATADYSALEDRLMANASKDENKILPFTKGIDGHSLNALSYFNDELSDIQERLDYQKQSEKFYKIELKDADKPVWYVGDKDPLLQLPNIINKEEIDKETCWINTINLIKKYYKSIRNKGKPYTFGFSYGAGAKKFGEAIYNAYWTLYKRTKEYNESVINEALKKNYIISRYSGLRLLAYNLAAKDEFTREQAKRVVVNFNIQSGNILTLYAMVKLQKLIEKENLINKIKLVNTVHDAIYLYVENDVETIDWLNRNLIKCMTEDYNNNKFEEAIVKLEAEMDIGKTMSEVSALPNECSQDEIIQTINQIQEKEN